MSRKCTKMKQLISMRFIEEKKGKIYSNEMGSPAPQITAQKWSCRQIINSEPLCKGTKTVAEKYLAIFQASRKSQAWRMGLGKCSGSAKKKKKKKKKHQTAFWQYVSTVLVQIDS